MMYLILEDYPATASDIHCSDPGLYEFTVYICAIKEF